ncbi:MAG TPA: Gfo/Idh/MocA family oxidoreductase [Pyrinomonadaceae bacterium]|nr:Gfo/Idh/MocA family oxidoreductase [Pyrinomonadaceae bacterium]HMP64313.1 Gfo/Idh/MocA family oxidoreductase [Pyrinomonadaceae bacterium]
MEKTVGIGIVGAGFARRVQIPAFSQCEGARLVSVSSGTLANAKAAAEEFDIEHFSNDWRETIARDDVDLVCITTPPNLHREMVLAALDAGKHILAEKPMAMNVAEAEEMTDAAKGKSVLALIDHELRFLPGRQKAYQMLRDGVIGKVLHAKYDLRAPHRADPAVPWNWWSDIEAGGGALGAINSHVIDSFNWFLGTEISSVYCQLQTHIKQRLNNGEMRDVTTDDEANMLLRFTDSELTSDATGIVSVSMIEGPEYVNKIEFVGTEGWMRVGHRGDVQIAKRGETEMTVVDVEYPPSISGVFESGFPSGFMAFAPKIIEAIRNGSTKIEHAATFEDGLSVQRVLDAARESSTNGARTLLSA